MLDDIAIVLTGHPRQQRYWPAALPSYDHYPGPLVLAYDDVDFAALPDHVTRRFASMVPTGEPANSLGHVRGELTCMQLGGRAAAGLGCSWLYKSAADTTCWRWRALAAMIAECRADGVNVLHYGTAIILAETSVYNAAMAWGRPRTYDAVAEAYWREGLRRAGACVNKIDDLVAADHRLGRIHVQGEVGGNTGIGVRALWQSGEIWPRQQR